MSWNPFSRLSASKKSVISRTAEWEFSKEVKRLEDLEAASRRLHRDAKKLIEANTALTKAERKLTQDLMNTTLCQTEEELRWTVEEWDHALVTIDSHMQDVNSMMHKTLIEPVRKFASIFPNVQTAIKKRDHSLQELQKCQSKVNKYKDRERTGLNIVKLDAAKKALEQAQKEFDTINASLREDMPQLYEKRIEYFQPSLQALIRSQIQYTTEALKVYGELSNNMNGQKDISNKEYATHIQQSLSDLRALSITVD